MAVTKPLRKGEKTLPPVRPSLGLEMAYRRKLDKLIEEMNRSVQYWVGASYKANEPRIVDIAQDGAALPANALRARLRQLAARWQRRFNQAAPLMADYFTTATAERSDITLRRILKEAGFTVSMQMTPAMRDVMQASINQQVSLIKSIPAQYFTQVEGSVMRAVTAGYDLAPLAKEIEHHYGVTRRRAAFIARDQVNKANATIDRTRRLELGITEAIWQHSHAGEVPRPRHLAFHGKRYDIAKGAPVGDHNGNLVQPGEEPGCRCLSKPILPTFLPHAH